jgi:hypothetical protein
MNDREISIQIEQKYNAISKKITDEIYLIKKDIHKDIGGVKDDVKKVLELLTGNEKFKIHGLIHKVSSNEESISDIIKYQESEDIRRQEQKLNPRVESLEELQKDFVTKKSLGWLIGAFTSVFSGVLLYVIIEYISK